MYVSIYIYIYMTLQIISVNVPFDDFEFNENEYYQYIQDRQEISFNEYIEIIIKSYNVIGNAIPKQLLHVMAIDIKRNSNKYNDYIIKSIDLALSQLIYIQLQNTNASDKKLDVLKQNIYSKWNRFLANQI